MAPAKNVTDDKQIVLFAAEARSDPTEGRVIVIAVQEALHNLDSSFHLYRNHWNNRFSAVLHSEITIDGSQSNGNRFQHAGNAYVLDRATGLYRNEADEEEAYLSAATMNVALSEHHKRLELTDRYPDSNQWSPLLVSITRHMFATDGGAEQIDVSNYTIEITCSLAFSFEQIRQKIEDAAREWFPSIVFLPEAEDE